MRIREWQTVKKLTYSTTTDAYGQLRTSTPSQTDVKMVVRVFSQSNNDNPLYVDVEMIGLTEDKTITTQNQILVGTTKYSVMYVIPSDRCYQILMRKAV